MRHLVATFALWGWFCGLASAADPAANPNYDPDRAHELAGQAKKRRSP